MAEPVPDAKDGIVQDVVPCKRPGANLAPSGVKRLRPYYRDAYRQLLNKEIGEIAQWETKNLIVNQDAEPIQHGSTIWTSEELNILFASLARHRLAGDGSSLADLSQKIYQRDLNRHVKVKSEPEIQALLLHIREKLRTMSASDRAFLSPNTAYFEAAAELSTSCIEALDVAADAITALHFRQDRLREQAVHGPLWRLQRKTAIWTDRCLGGSEMQVQEVRTQLPEAELLNLANFLVLSRRVFMNSGDLTMNWTSHVEGSEKPALIHSAFVDFHVIVVTLIRRLVQTSMYAALSRTNAKKKPEEETLKVRDVMTAIDMLGLPRNSSEFWIESARRHKLDVTDPRGQKYSFVEVEERLRRRRRQKLEEELPGSDESSEVSRFEESSLEEMSEGSTAIETSSESEGSVGGDPDKAAEQDQGLDKEDRVEANYNGYLEAFDRTRNLAEERRLWKVLKRDPKLEMPVLKTQRPNQSYRHRRVDGEDRDWRYHTRLVAEWESFAAPIPTKDFGA